MSKYFLILKYLFRIPDLRKRVLIILFLLLIFRLTANIPLPDINLEKIQNFLAGNQLFGLINIFSGNALSRFSIALLGVAPYITAVIILQLLTLIFPQLKELYYEQGEIGRAKFNQFARILTLPLAGLQAFGFLSFLRAQGVISPTSFFDLFRDVIIVTTGSMFLMWIGELISEQKLANGISLLIFAGIVANFPQIGGQIFVTFSIADIEKYLIFAILSLFVVAGIVLINESERKIPLTFARRVRGTKMYGGANTYLPVKINNAGVIPIIFAISVLIAPATFAQILSATGSQTLMKISTEFQKILNNNLIYGFLYFILVFAFTYFYTSITFEPHELAVNLQKNGAFIPGIRPGKETEIYLSRVVHRTTFWGGIFLGLVAVLPIITQAFTGMQFLTIGGTSILIVVAVAIETFKQIEAELSARKYEV